MSRVSPFSLVTVVTLQLALTQTLSCHDVHAEIYQPSDDHEVLLRLPSVPDSVATWQRGGTELRASASADHRLSVARAFIELNRAEAEPRYLGYAESALAPWRDDPRPPPSVLVLRAHLYQSRHAFDRALADLDLALSESPLDAQAWLTRAGILMVMGRYAEALASCRRLAGLSEPLVATTCIASVAGRSGQLENAYALLSRVYATSPSNDAGVRVWALTHLAEMSAARGHAAAALAHFHQALAVGRENAHLESSYADFLLDQGEPEAVIALLENRPSSDARLLRLALARRQLGPQTTSLVTVVRERIAARQRRGDDPHLRETARALIHLVGDADRGLATALRNWSVQREPWDARLVLEAALAAGRPAAATPVLAWLEQSGLEHVTIRALRDRLSERQ